MSETVKAEVDLIEYLMEHYDDDCKIGEYYQATALRIITALRAKNAAMAGIGRAYLKDLVEGRVYILSGTPDQIKEYDDRIKEVRDALPSEGDDGKH